MIDKNIAVKAIPEEDYVFLVFKVDVGSREHVRVQAAERQDPETKDDFSIGGSSEGPAGHTGGSQEPAGAVPGGEGPAAVPGVIGEELEVVVLGQGLEVLLQLLLRQAGRQPADHHLRHDDDDGGR